MNIGGSQANDAFLRIPVQGRILVDAGPAPSAGQNAGPGDGTIGARRSDSLRTVSGNRIDPPSTGGLIGRPYQNPPQMEEIGEVFSAPMRNLANAWQAALREAR